MAVKKGFLKGIDKIQDDQVILIGSVTDAYQPLEKSTNAHARFCRTYKIVKVW